MDKHELDLRITEAARSIRSYCIARTPNQAEAEDLAQDIIVELYGSAHNLRNADAFYGFMWGVAGNVYRQWCKNKRKHQFCELDEQLQATLPEQEESEELQLLRRELSLLSEKYRKAVILYYMENKSCGEVSEILSTSESMVKYLLFKSRQILKEGMNMERNYGQQSYNPKELSFAFWGEGANRYYHLCDSKISQNILFACYHEKLTAEQISLEIGVAIPYLEDKIRELSEFSLLKKEGNKYETNIVIFTEDFIQEVVAKTAGLKEKIADILVEAISGKEEAVRKIGFWGADMNENSFAWQMVSFILCDAVLDRLQSSAQLEYPTDSSGMKCFVWGVENNSHIAQGLQKGFGHVNASNENGDAIRFMDFLINGKMMHEYYAGRSSRINIFLDIAKGSTAHFSENDQAEAAEMVRRGYVISDSRGLSVNVPVFTKEQYQNLKELFSEESERIAAEAGLLIDTVAKILKNHCPVHLKKQAKDLAYLRLFEDAVSAPVVKLLEQKYLLPYGGEGIFPTTYVVLM